MRRIVVASFCFLAFFCATALAQAALKPFQQAALERMLADMEPSMREMMRPSLEQSLVLMNEAQVQMLLDSMDDDGSEASEEVSAETYEETTASPADLEFNRAQYEPVIRRAWTAGKAYDEFVEAELAAACPGQGSYAVFGSGWRYEVYPLNPNWPRVSDSADLDVQILGASYAPQDGRYRFDFSDVRDSFDRDAVRAAIQRVCAEYRAIGEAFMAEARAKHDGDIVQGGYELERQYNARLNPLRLDLEAVLQAEAPSANNALYMALLNGEPAG